MKIPPPMKVHGGKFYLKKFVISHFPSGYESMVYVEPCCGACNILLAKNKSQREIVNDLDPAVYNLLYFLKTEPKAMLEKVKEVEYSKEAFLAAKAGTKTGLDGAVNELVVRRLSRGGLKNAFSWSTRLRGGRPGDLNAFEQFKTRLPLISDRLSGVEIYNKNVIDLVRVWKDYKDFLWYIDPTYLPSTRTCKNCYDLEMSEEDHVALAESLNNVKGKVLLSGYYSDLYTELFKGWNLVTKEIVNHSSQAKKKEKRVECLWTNF